MTKLPVYLHPARALKRSRIRDTRSALVFAACHTHAVATWSEPTAPLPIALGRRLD